ncbi:outer membrane lipoprotein-sorting protein, partial [bacterium]|nr:outer membrane lipoprotein-sorting protein [bacterium]
MRKLVSVFVLSASLSAAVNAFELDGNLDAAQKGYAIAVESDRRDQGWGDMTAELQMILIDRKGRRSERKLRIRNLEVEGDGDKALTIFDAPRDVKGTAFLSFTHALEPDDQWLFLSALNKVKRISSENKSGPFMGSEFAFEDLSSFEVEKYTYEYIGEDKVGETECYASKLYP